MVSMICKPAILGQPLMIPLLDEVPAGNFAKDVFARNIATRGPL